MAPGFKPIPLKNINNLCYRNSVLHALFSIDYFMNLVDWGYELTQKPIYLALGDAAERFRGSNHRTNRAEKDVREFMRRIGTSSAGNRDWEPQELFKHKGTQEAAELFLTYLMQRLCGSELTDDLLG